MGASAGAAEGFGAKRIVLDAAGTAAADGRAGELGWLVVEMLGRCSEDLAAVGL